MSSSLSLLIQSLRSVLKVLLSNDDCDDSITTLNFIRRVSRKCMESIDFRHSVKSSRLIPLLISICQLIALPNVNDEVHDVEAEICNTSLPTLMISISQFFANYSSFGFDCACTIWKYAIIYPKDALSDWNEDCVRDNDLMGLQHLIVAANKIQNVDKTNKKYRNALVASVACIYNCMVKFYDNYSDLSTKYVQCFLQCKPLCCQLFLVADPVQTKLLNLQNNKDSKESAKDDGDINADMDPVVEWLYLLIHLLVKRGDLTSLFLTIGSKKLKNIDSREILSDDVTDIINWYDILTHEQIVCLYIVTDVYNEYNTTTAMISHPKYEMSYFEHRIVEYLRSKQNEAYAVSNTEEDVSADTAIPNLEVDSNIEKLIIGSHFFEDHCKFISYLMRIVLPMYLLVIKREIEAFMGLCYKNNQITWVNTNIDRNMFLAVTKLCTDVVSSGIMLIPTTMVCNKVHLLFDQLHDVLMENAFYGFKKWDLQSSDVNGESCVSEPLVEYKLFVLFSEIVHALTRTAKTPTESLERKINEYDQMNPEHPDISGISPEESVSDEMNNLSNTNSNPTSSFIQDEDIVLANQVVKSIVNCISNLIYRNKLGQDLLRISNTIPIILNQCHTNMNNPFIREHSLMCIRNACENNMENQKVIESYRQAAKS